VTSKTKNLLASCGRGLRVESLTTEGKRRNDRDHDICCLVLNLEFKDNNGKIILKNVI